VRAALERHPRPLQGLDQRTGLGLGPIEHGDIGERQGFSFVGRGTPAVQGKEGRAAQQTLDRVHHVLRLGPVARAGVDLDLLGPQGACLQPAIAGQAGRGDELEGRVHNRLCRAVVAPQRDRARAGKILAEPPKAVRVRAPESVDRLVRGADRAHVAAGRRQEPEQLILGRIQVLAFVDRDPAIARAIVLQQGRVFLEQLERQSDQVVEVDPAPRTQLALVNGHRLGVLGLGRGIVNRPLAPAAGNACQELTGRAGRQRPTLSQHLGALLLRRHTHRL